jgi:hypothetical protein
METVRRSPAGEHLWRTLSCLTWRHGIAFPASLRANVCPVHSLAVHAFVLSFVSCHELHRDERRLHYRLCQRPRRFATRHTFGLTMPTPTGIALAMARKLTARWCYKCSRPCRGTPKPVKNAHQQDPRRPRYRAHHTRAMYLPGYDRREGRPSMPTSRRYRCRLLRPYCGARFA